MNQNKDNKMEEYDKRELIEIIKRNGTKDVLKEISDYIEF